ncbi:hypothetical protein D9619_011437 [Psilocybe cf. subviscida]|uniref:Uncharacterized protein n=1 Tax=Psilocybe cf. subviscida TaxID=2480587 RepID=A0A8H5BT39_9AGAR|nr:hypothetical protein D9619_011437 [Psilocybe cf. subviscida]
MALRTLPQDVLADILDIGLFSRPELCAISLASPHLRYEAQRRLFRDPGPHSIDLRDEPSASLATTRTFLETITASPDRLAQMVRRYRVTVLWFDFYVRFDSEKIQLQHTLFELLSRALPLMVNLIELLYRERLQTSGHPVSEPPPSMWPVLQMCSFKLQIFWCSYIGTNSRNAVAEFLHIQNGIRVLWLCEAPQAHATNMITLLRQVYSDMCPALVSLGGTLDVVASMLSGRQSLQHMSWDDTTYGPPVKYDGELFRSTNTSTVETLESLKNGPPLNLICGNFENLVALKTCEFDLMQVCF